MLWALLEIALLALSAAILVSTLVVFVEVVASLFSNRKAYSNAGKELRVAVVVPAHNESAGLLPTLANLSPQLSQRDRLLVVADNCSDDTAAIGRKHGSEVIERNDTRRVGKGFALDFGIRHLGANPPDVVVIIDADCRTNPGAIAILAGRADETQRPVQALYLMKAPPGASVGQRASEFAWRIKNQVRPLGLHNLGLPCQLMGAGMAFPWRLFSEANLATGHIVEDLVLGTDLAEKGYAPVFCPEALVTSVFPTSAEAAVLQRTRWEHGYVRVLVSRGPRLLVAALYRMDFKLLALALDLLVPPLSLLGFVVLCAIGASAGLWVVGLPVHYLVLNVLGLALLGFSICVSWSRFGKDILPRSQLPLAIGYLASKVSVYRKLFSGQAITRWSRTDRG